jgi:hypothetical protein
MSHYQVNPIAPELSGKIGPNVYMLMLAAATLEGLSGLYV